MAASLRLLLNPVLLQPTFDQPTGAARAGRARLVLVWGFAGLLAILLALGFFAADALRRARTADSNGTGAFLARRGALAEFRRAIYTASGAVRDYLVNPDEGEYATHATPARDAFTRARDALSRYQRSAASLRAEFTAFENQAEQALRLAGANRRRDGYEVLTRRLGPMRDRLLDRIEELAHADQTELRATVNETASVLERLQTNLWIALGASVLMSLLLAIFVYRYLAGLEAVAAAKYRESMEAATQLERLSHRLLAVQEEERKALARELHDEVGQSLGALLVDLGQARQALTKDTTEARPRLESAVLLGERTMRTIRDISLLLRPSMLDELGLLPALHWQAREVSRRTGMVVTVHSSDEDLELPEAWRTAVFRVVQEALQNAARHAAATAVEVGLASGGGQLRIIVTDNGCGFDPATTRGLGLLGMQERVVGLGGVVRLHSAPGQGTTVTAELPLPETKES